MPDERPVEVPPAVLRLLTADPARIGALDDAAWRAVRDQIGRFTGTPVEKLDAMRARRKR